MVPRERSRKGDRGQSEGAGRKGSNLREKKMRKLVGVEVGQPLGRLRIPRQGVAPSCFLKVCDSLLVGQLEGPHRAAEPLMSGFSHIEFQQEALK